MQTEDVEMKSEEKATFELVTTDAGSKNDSLVISIWRNYMKQKSQLPNSERMDKLMRRSPRHSSLAYELMQRGTFPPVLINNAVGDLGGPEETQERTQLAYGSGGITTRGTHSCLTLSAWKIWRGVVW